MRDHEARFGNQSDDDLRAMNQGCTEVTCLYHGAINAELIRRGASRTGRDNQGAKGESA